VHESDASGSVGRDRGLAVLASFVEDPRDCLVLEGEAGMGKTTTFLADVAAGRSGRHLGLRLNDESRPVGGSQFVIGRFALNL